MLIVKAPLRISLGGGGTDLPSYYQRFGSTFISAAIDKYIYISLHKIFIDDLIIKYSELERVKSPGEIKHPIIKACLERVGVKKALEISSFADIPSGTGLGSSGTFTVALLKALYTHVNRLHHPMELAEDACDVEINQLGSPVGKQDQYIAAVGGLTRFEIDTQGKVTSAPLKIDQAARIDLEEHLLLFFTGFSRSANEILREQDEKTRAATKAAEPSASMIENLHFVKEMGVKSQQLLEKNDLAGFAELMNVHWEHKKKRSKDMSRPEIDAWYRLGLANGALGGKLVGAGGGGFLMFLAEDKRRLRKAMNEAGLHDVPFRFDQLGAQVVLRDD
jgi:D-glycero-alpha-D-manno-heptose-7-phosphate kinase